MKSLKHIFLAIILCAAGTHTQAALEGTPYAKDAQVSYNNDNTYKVFSFASNVACFIRSMAPEQMPLGTPYLARVDKNKCNDDAAASNASSSSGEASGAPNYQSAIVTPLLDANNNLTAKVKMEMLDDNGTREHIQVYVTIYGGPTTNPPYGAFDMDYCSSTIGNEGKCDYSRGFVRVNSTGLTVYQDSAGRYSNSYAKGKINFSSSSGKAGSGRDESNNWNTSGLVNDSFSFADGKYYLQTTGVTNPYCLSPKMSTTGTKFSVWENWAYDKTTGKRISYTNSGFQLNDPSTHEGVGYASYFGVNFWTDAPSAYKNLTAGQTVNVSASVGGNDATYTAHVTPGTMRRIVTTHTNLDGIAGIGMHLNFWGNNGSQGCNFAVARGVSGLNCSANPTPNVSLLATWDKANSRFSTAGYQICNNSGCNNVATNAIGNVTISDLQSYGTAGQTVNSINLWSDSGTSYNGGLYHWNSSTNQNDALTLSQIVLTTNLQTTVMPTDASLTAITPASPLMCVGTCPKVSGGNLVEGSDQVNPVYYTWNASKGSLSILAGGVNSADTGVLVDFSAKGMGGKYYQLFEASKNNSLKCGSGSSNYCAWNYTSTSGASWFAWQSGNTWDSFIYLTDSTGSVINFSAPKYFSYTVSPNAATDPSYQGISTGYAGQTITIQSPGAGQMWLPGHCEDVSGALANCGSGNSSHWVNDVYIPTRQDQYGSVTSLNADGTLSANSYYVKWLRRGVYFAQQPVAACTGLSIPGAGDVTLPDITNWNNPASSVGWGITRKDLSGTAAVIDGILQ